MPSCVLKAHHIEKFNMDSFYATSCLSREKFIIDILFHK